MAVQRLSSSGAQPITNGTTTEHDSSSPNKVVIIAPVVVVALICSSLALFYLLRTLRIRGHSPKYLPTAYLKRKWDAWTPSSEKRGSQGSQTEGMDMLQPTGYAGLSTAEQGGATTSDVDRHASIRSIMTLPPYSAAIRPTEQLIAREGERAGVDTVVEFPETGEEEEARREAEMAALYQVRVARRETRDARDENRRLRREARERGDRAAVEELDRQRQQRRDEEAAAAQQQIRAEGQHRERGRRISTVAYASLGIARHDGSRVRSDSASSDHRPLLDSAASMGGGDGGRLRGQSGSQISLPFPNAHFRNASTSSLARFMTPDYSDDDRSSAGGARSRSGSAVTDFEVVPTHSHPLPGSTGAARSRATSSVSALRLTAVPSSSSSSATPAAAVEVEHAPPPEYDNLSPIHASAGSRTEQRAETAQSQIPTDAAPPYESPTATTAPGLPHISVTPFTPVSAADSETTTGWATPVGRGEEDDDEEERTL